jgi:type I restriction enzyme S subunit
MDKSKWEYKKLGEVADITMGQSPSSESYNADGNGLPFYQGNADFGDLFPKERLYCSSPTREALQNDLLMSVRAPIGALNIANRHCCIGRGLCSIRPKDGVSVTKFLYYYLYSHNAELNKEGTGSTFKAINKNTINSFIVTQPPLSDQHHIVSELDQLSAIISLKQQQMKAYDALAQSLFYEMFGDPVSNSKEWKEEPLEKIGLLARGVSKHRPRNDKSLLGGTMPLIQTGDIANCGLYLTKYFQTYSELGIAQSKVWPRGTLCITIAANIGKAAILNFDACFPDSVVGFLPNKDKTNNIYMYYVFGQLQKILEENAPSVAQKNINLRILNSTNIPLPPLSLQRSFAEKVKAIEHQKSLLKQSIAETQTLLDSRMQEYFG